MLKFAKKSKKNAITGGAGGFEKFTHDFLGGRPKNHVCPQGGGGSKMSKNFNTKLQKIGLFL